MTHLATSPFGRRSVLFAGASLAAAALSPFNPLGSGAAHAAPGGIRAPRVAGRRVARVPSSIDGAGRTDVTRPLTKWLDGLPAGSIADLAGRTFRCETAIKLVDKSDLIIRNGVLLRTDAATHGGIVYPRPNPHLWLLRPSRCRVEKMTIRGTNTVSDEPSTHWTGTYKVAYEFEAAIRFERFTDCAAVDITVDSVWGDGIQAHVGTGMLIDNVTVVRNGRQGITPQGRNFIIRNCHISSRRSGIDMEPNSDSDLFGNVLIDGNIIRSRLLAITSGGRGEFSNVEVRNNTITLSGIPCINAVSSHGGRRDRWNVHHNKLPEGLGSPLAAFSFARSRGTTVEYNHSVHGAQNSRARRAAVSVSGGSELKVRHNWFENAATVVRDTDGTCRWVEESNQTGSVPPPGWWE